MPALGTRTLSGPGSSHVWDRFAFEGSASRGPFRLRPGGLTSPGAQATQTPG